jgi:5-methylcytosine-specific restriction endonuclease McrA
MGLRVCIRCGTPADPARRCPRCGYHPRPRGQDDRSWSERQRRRATVDAWVAAHGLVCPGYAVPRHAVSMRSDLTADHVTPISLGGRIDGPLAVLCRRCNVRKGGRNRVRRAS